MLGNSLVLILFQDSHTVWNWMMVDSEPALDLEATERTRNHHKKERERRTHSILKANPKCREKHTIAQVVKIITKRA